MTDLAPVYSFGPFRLDAAKSRLEHNGYVVSLPPQAVHVLQVLVENHGRLVTKQELVRRVWEVDTISDSNIFKQIALIRKALAPGFDSDPIQTTSGRGYRFLAPVQLSPAPQASGAPEPVTAEARRPAVTAWRSAAMLVVLLGIAAVFSLRNSGIRTAAIGRKTIQRVTHSGVTAAPAISRDGRRIAYVEQAPGDTARVLRVCEARSLACTVVARGTGSAADTNIIFSEDGESIFAGLPQGPSPGPNIYRIPIGGGPPNVVVRGTADLMGITAGERSVVYLRSTAQEDALFAAPLNGGPEGRIAGRYRPDRLMQAAISPDGKTVACAWLVFHRDAFYYSIVTFPFPGGQERLLGSERWPATNVRPRLQWLPDGSAIAAVLNDRQTGLRQIFLLAYPSGAIRPVTGDLASYDGLGISGDGSTLITVKDDESPQLWISAGADTSRMRQLTRGSTGFGEVTWMPNGRLLAISQGMWLVDPASGEKEPVRTSVPADGPAMSDGTALYFVSTRTGAREIWTSGMDGSNAMALTRSATATHATLSRDGRWIVYSAPVSDGFELWKMPARGGKPERVGEGHNCTESAISFDDRWIAAVCADSEGRYRRVTIFPMEGGRAVTAFDLPADSSPYLDWTPAGEISYVRGAGFGGISNIWLQATGNGEPKQVTQFDSMRISRFGWARDGRLVVSRGTHAADAVLIRNFY